MIDQQRQIIHNFAKAYGLRVGDLYLLTGEKDRAVRKHFQEGTLPVKLRAKFFYLTKDKIFAPCNDEEKIQYTELEKRFPKTLLSFHQKYSAVNPWIAPISKDITGDAKGSLEDIQYLWTLVTSKNFTSPETPIKDKHVRETAQLIRLLTLHLGFYAAHPNEEIRLTIHSQLEESLHELRKAFEIFHRQFPMKTLKELLRHEQAINLFKK